MKPHYELHLLYAIVLVLESFGGRSIALGTMIGCLRKLLHIRQMIHEGASTLAALGSGALLVSGAISECLVPSEIHNYVTKGVKQTNIPHKGLSYSSR